jgi:hypothetical protein
VKQADRLQRAPIDWQAIGKRLTAAAVATQEALRPSPERVRRILDERAGNLARPSVDPHSARNTTDVVSFVLGGERYCIETRCVREVRRYGDVTPLPGVPDFLVGVTNLRGEILPLIDLRGFLDLPSRGPAVPSHVIVCGDARSSDWSLTPCMRCRPWPSMNWRLIRSAIASAAGITSWASRATRPWS